VNEARLEQTGAGLIPAEEGWFVLNVRDGLWVTSEKFGSSWLVDGPQELFSQVGYRLKVLMPGQPNGFYHHEANQEDFLVLAGECVLLVEGEERRLRAWDFVHCPGGTDHIFVGAGDGPCVLFMAGSREGWPEGEGLFYPRSEPALRHGASVEADTPDPGEAYAGSPEWEPRPSDADGLPWSEA
jgi:uncharacterized cupin superfamily protein